MSAKPKLSRRIKQLEDKTYKQAFPSISLDLVRIVAELREETERLRKLSNEEFESYLEIAERTLVDPTDIALLPKRTALRRGLEEKKRQRDSIDKHC